MKDIQERSKGITSHITNLGLVHERLIEEISCVLLLNFLIPFLLLVILLAPLLNAFIRLHRGPRNVETHLNQLVRASRSLLAAVLGTPIRLTVGTVRLVQRKLHGDFILARQVGIGDLGVGKLERGTVEHVERQFSLGKLRLAPVPSSDRVFALFDVDTVPDLECLAQPLKVLSHRLGLSPEFYGNS